MEDDKEVSAMAAVNAALAGLDADAVGRVLRWAADRYGVSLPGRKASQKFDQDKADEAEEPQDSAASRTFTHFSDLFDAADPTTDEERVLVSAYWFQVVQGQAELDSQSLNKELKNTGHGVSHMPHALDALMNAKPRLLVQLKKKGTTRQARREFKLTTEGIRKVKGMIEKA